MKKLGKTLFPLALVAAFVLGLAPLFSTALEARPLTTCPVGKCINTSGWMYYSSCNIYDAASDCLYSCKEYRYPSTGSRCYTGCIPL